MKSKIEDKPHFGNIAIFGDESFFRQFVLNGDKSPLAMIGKAFKVKEHDNGKALCWKMQNDIYASISSQYDERQPAARTVFIAFDMNHDENIKEQINNAQRRCINAKKIYLVFNTDGVNPEQKERLAKKYKEIAEDHDALCYEYSAETGAGIKEIEDAFFVLPEEKIEKKSINPAAEYRQAIQCARPRTELDELKTFISGPDYNKLGKRLFFNFTPKHITEMSRAATFQDMKNIAQKALNSESPRRDPKVQELYHVIINSNSPEDVKGNLQKTSITLGKF